MDEIGKWTWNSLQNNSKEKTIKVLEDKIIGISNIKFAKGSEYQLQKKDNQTISEACQFYKDPTKTL